MAGTGLAPNLAADGQYFAIFTDGHHRQLPRLTGGPFRYKTYAADYLKEAVKMASKPLKQAVIAPSMLSLLYPLYGEVDGYTREQFLQDLCDECEKDIGQCFAAGASRVSYKLIGEHSREDANGVAQVCFIGVINPENPRIETPEEVRDDFVLASKYIPKERLGSTDDCGFSPFSMDNNPNTARPTTPAISLSGKSRTVWREHKGPPRNLECHKAKASEWTNAHSLPILTTCADELLAS